jgi:hypothetical protein
MTERMLERIGSSPCFVAELEIEAPTALRTVSALRARQHPTSPAVPEMEHTIDSRRVTCTADREDDGI